MRKLLFLFCGILLCGCDKPLTNDQIISEVKKCEAAGLKAHLYVDNEWAEYKITYVQCEVK